MSLGDDEVEHPEGEDTSAPTGCREHDMGFWRFWRRKDDAGVDAMANDTGRDTLV